MDSYEGSSSEDSSEDSDAATGGRRRRRRQYLERKRRRIAAKKKTERRRKDKHRSQRRNDKLRARRREQKLQDRLNQMQHRAAATLLAGSSGTSGAAPAPKPLVDISKHSAEPPEPQIQSALHAAFDAQQASIIRSQSPAELALMARCPPLPVAGETLHPDYISWQLEVMQLRIKEDIHVKPEPKAAWYGKLILNSSLLCPTVVRPTAQSDWKAPIQPRQYRSSDFNTSQIDDWRSQNAVSSFDLGTGQTVTSAKRESMPPQVSGALEYNEKATLLGLFFAASNRFTTAELAAHTTYVTTITKLLRTYPVADVMRYDDAFRLSRHMLCDGDAPWLRRDEELFKSYITDPQLTRNAAAKPGGGGGDGGGDDGSGLSKKARAAKKRAEAAAAGASNTNGNRLSAAALAAYWARPCYKFGKQNLNGKQVGVCKNWLWGGCSDPCSHPKRSASYQLIHKCSFCKADHRLADCSAYTAAHPADFAKGQH